MYNLGNYDKALDYFNLHLKIFPEDDDIYKTLGTLYERMNKALTDFGAGLHLKTAGTTCRADLLRWVSIAWE